MYYQTEKSFMDAKEVHKVESQIVQVLAEHTGDLQMAKMILDNLNLDAFATLK
ncbi:hypothetical protein [Lacticaseibacillus absianus]|uniref:hypothetical protein n=1 Tax=Lacticaseibacillus absianus TaxID=2729623 RepID=UPI0015CA5BB6|nr:hypothetical protein [Lacticaseibacillus absianus]